MNKKNKYIYSKNLFMKDPYKKVDIEYKNIIGRLFCKHHFLYLVREGKNQLYFNISGDKIEIICPKCGKSQGTTFWEYEGMGYK